MQFQAREMEELVRRGQRSSDVLPAEETISVMETWTGSAATIGVRYPGEPEKRPGRVPPAAARSSPSDRWYRQVRGQSAQGHRHRLALLAHVGQAQGQKAEGIGQHRGVRVVVLPLGPRAAALIR